MDPGDELAAVIAQHLIDAAEAEPDDSDVAELNARATELLERAARRAHGLGAPWGGAAAPAPGDRPHARRRGVQPAAGVRREGGPGQR